MGLHAATMNAMTQMDFVSSKIFKAISPLYFVGVYFENACWISFFNLSIRSSSLKKAERYTSAFSFRFGK
jgi:hypothetical protein